MDGGRDMVDMRRGRRLRGGECIVVEADRSMDSMVDCHVVDGAAAAGDA